MPWFSRPPEQRRFPRFKADISAVASLVRDRDIISVRTRCDSISEGGVGAHGRDLEPLRLGDLVTVELHIPVSTQTIWVDTIVRYVVTHRRTGRCGLEFLSLTEDQRSVIKHYCRLQPSEKALAVDLVPPVGSAPETGGKGRTKKTWGRVLDVMPLPAFALRKKTAVSGLGCGPVM